MVRVFLAFTDDDHRDAVVDALEHLGPWPDAELVIHAGDGAYVECYGYDMQGAELLVQRRLWSALVGTPIHPDSVCTLSTPPRPGE